MSTELRAALDAYVGQQPEPRPSRSELIRKILEDRLIHEGLIQPSPDVGTSAATAADQVTIQEEKINALPSADPEPSPEAAMNVMRRAVAENELVDLKNLKLKPKRRSAKAPLQK